MKQRILVLGGSGFIGSRIVAALDASGWATPVVPRHRTAGPDALHPAVDATRASDIARELGEVGAVVNAVAGPPAAIRANAQALFSAASAMRVAPRVIYLSSMAVYGDVEGVVDEAEPVNGRGAYAQAKIEAERIAAGYRRSVVFRPGCVYGLGGKQWTQRMAGWLSEGRVGDLGAAGDGICNLVYVDDLAAAVLAALRHPAVDGQVFNVAMRSPPTWNEYFLVLARAIGALPVRRIPQRRLALESKLLAPPLKLAQIAARALGLRGDGLPEPMPPSLLRLFRQRIELNVQKAEAVLGFRSVPLI